MASVLPAAAARSHQACAAAGSRSLSSSPRLTMASVSPALARVCMAVCSTAVWPAKWAVKPIFQSESKLGALAIADCQVAAGIGNC